MSPTIARASLSGTTQLLTLCGIGAFLARRGILNSSACRSLAAGVYTAFLPALLFCSTHSALRRPSLDLLLPPLWALLTLVLSALTAAPVAALLRPPHRRVVFVALLLGNANNLPILLLHSLCDTVETLSSPTCVARADSYVALFVTAWNTVMWSVVLRYLSSGPDTARRIPNDVVSVQTATSVHGNATLLRPMAPLSESSPTNVASSRHMLFSPPFIAILAGGITAHLPLITRLVDNELASVMEALHLLGGMVVPASSLIVGARLYTFRFQNGATNEEGKEEEAMQELSPLAIVGIVLTRFVMLPVVGRVVYRLIDMPAYVNDPLLRIYTLVPYFVPTASNTVVMVQMAARSLPNSGETMERTLLTLIFWQYLVAPLFLTANMALGLELVFDERPQFGL